MYIDCAFIYICREIESVCWAAVTCVLWMMDGPPIFQNALLMTQRRSLNENHNSERAHTLSTTGDFFIHSPKQWRRTPFWYKNDQPIVISLSFCLLLYIIIMSYGSICSRIITLSGWKLLSHCENHINILIYREIRILTPAK